MQFNPAATWGNARKVAGISDSRQVRDVKYGNIISYSRVPFLALFGGTIKGEDKQNRTTAPTIASRAVQTLTPEIYDDEVAPSLFRITVASGAGDVGSSITVGLSDVSGLNVGDKIGYPEKSAEARITAISGTQVTLKVIYSAGGSVTWDASTNDANLEKLNNAQSDAPTIGTGTYREMIQRINGLQFGIQPMSQGILQGLVSLYGNPGGEGSNQDWAREVYNKTVDFNRAREQGLVLSQAYYTEGSGDTRIIHSKGLMGWAGAVVPNPNADGSLPYEDFVNFHMGAARAVGGSFEVYGLCGLGVSTVLSSYQQKQIRVTNISEKYKAGLTRIETPAGNLNLIFSDVFDSTLRAGQMLTFLPDYLERCFLKGLDVKMFEGLELNNVLGTRAALGVCEAIMASNPSSIRLHTNIRKAA